MTEEICSLNKINSNYTSRIFQRQREMSISVILTGKYDVILVSI